MDSTLQIESIEILNNDCNRSTIQSPKQLVRSDTFSNALYILSNADEELIILIAFKNTVDLKTITIHSYPHIHPSQDDINTSPPKQIHIIKIYNINKTFDDIKTLKSHITINCSTKKLAKGQNIILDNTVKTALQFKKIRYLAIYIESNQNNTENTHINGIEFCTAKQYNLLKKRRYFRNKINPLITLDENYIREEIKDNLDDNITNWKTIQLKIWGKDIFIDENIDYQTDHFINQILMELTHYKFRMKCVYTLMREQKIFESTTRIYQRPIVPPDKWLTLSPKLQESLQLQILYDLAKDNDQKIAQRDCDSCMNIDDLKKYCKPLKRIIIVLKAYHLSMSTMQEVKLFDVIQNKGIYEHQQLLNDFLHIKLIHIDVDNGNIKRHDHSEQDMIIQSSEYLNIGRKMCKYFEEELNLKCDHEVKCRGLMRHYKRGHGDDEQWSMEDSTFQAECDKIHAYFLHSTVKLGIEWDDKEKEVKEANMLDELNHYREPTDSKEEEVKLKKAKGYIGKKEDNEWWRHVQPDDEKQDDEYIYRNLIKKMNIFRWQNPHGFETGKSQGISHYKPKWKNVKEEALQNEYQQLSADNWNQTLRKSKIFFNSWARRRISTKYKGYYYDQVFEHKEEWKEGEVVEIKDIVTLKLYTDFDKLQFALKKCFRFESFENIMDDQDMTDQQILTERERQKKVEQELANRLRNFYHWRSHLLIVLNKFGTKLNAQNNMILYHGINAKMIIRPSETYAFNGPLSTTSSYHVARTFSTAKGMVLRIASHFPRLNYCTAFNASLISDYPEEQEWLVGFMYVRLLKVRTRKLFDKIQSFDMLLKKANLSSIMREIFFAIHLFKEQIFCMSEHLEIIQSQFLQVNRKQCCNKHIYEIYKKQGFEQSDDWNIRFIRAHLCKVAGHISGKESVKIFDDEIKQICVSKEQQNDIDRNMKIYPIIWNKFNEFRQQPNIRQRIKFDTISDHLKSFFMKRIGFKNIETGEQKWMISFVEISKVYSNVKEIHFVNQYRFDDMVLDSLIKQIKLKENSIRKIVFLYYNYQQTTEENKPLNDKIFKDPDTLNKQLLRTFEKEGWKIKHNKNGNAGYKIRLYDTKIT